MRVLILAVLILEGFVQGVCAQAAPNPPGQPSLAEAARDGKKTKQPEQPKTIAAVVGSANGPVESGGAPAGADTLQESTPRLPDLVLQGVSNVEDIMQSLQSIKKERGPVEAEAALHRWYDKHDALLVDALQTRDGMGSKEILQNVAISLRIQAAFLRVVAEFPKLGFQPEWFKIHCNEGNLAPCRQDVNPHP